MVSNNLMPSSPPAIPLLCNEIFARKADKISLLPSLITCPSSICSTDSDSIFDDYNSNFSGDNISSTPDKSPHIKSTSFSQSFPVKQTNKSENSAKRLSENYKNLFSRHNNNNIEPGKAAWILHSVDQDCVCAKYLVNYSLPAKLVQNYKPLAEIGHGNFGFVLAAESLSNGEEVAMKFIFKDKVPIHNWIQDPMFGLVPNEVYILNLLRTANRHIDGVIEMLEVFQDRQFIILIMELHGCPWTRKQYHQVNGNAIIKRPSYDLFECIESRGASLSSSVCNIYSLEFDEKTTRYIAAQIVHTVYKLDLLGIIHRDLKDENILIDQNLQVKLVDFGSSVKKDPHSMSTYSKFYGTVPFAAPEILKGQRYRAEPAEIWAVGILICIILCGESPFLNSEEAKIGNWEPHVRTLLIRRNLRISRHLHILLSGMFRSDPEERLNISDVFHHSWWNAWIK